MKIKKPKAKYQYKRAGKWIDIPPERYQKYKKKGTKELRKFPAKNSVSFVFHTKNFEKKIEQVKQVGTKVLRPLTYKGMFPPFAAIVTFKIGYSDSTRRRYFEKHDMELPPYFYTASKTPPGFRITPARLKKFIIGEMESYQENAEQKLQANPDYNLFDIYNLKEIQVRFIYYDEDPNVTNI